MAASIEAEASDHSNTKIEIDKTVRPQSIGCDPSQVKPTPSDSLEHDHGGSLGDGVNLALSYRRVGNVRPLTSKYIPPPCQGKRCA